VNRFFPKDPVIFGSADKVAVSSSAAMADFRDAVDCSQRLRFLSTSRLQEEDLI
jgi:hypothetical protein